MMNRELYIGGKKVDLPDNVNFNLVWQCANPGELKIYGSGSSTVKLPFTPANDAVFQRSRFVNVMTDAVFATFDARYYEDNMLMFSDGKASLLAVSDSYEVALTWGNTDHIQKLKDTPIYTLSLGAFKWDDSHMYPMAETSGDSQHLPALYTDGNQALMFRHALSRPLVYYSSLLAQVGITLDNAPSDIMTRCGLSFVQVNSTNSYGVYNKAVNLTGGCEIISYAGSDVEPQYNPYTTTFKKVTEIDISQSGTFGVRLIDAIKSAYYSNYANDQSYFGLCFFLTSEDFGDGGYIGRGEFIFNAFSNYNRDKYQPMYRVEQEEFIDNATGLPHYSWNLTGEEVKPVALAYAVDEGNVNLFDIGDFRNEEIKLESGTYRLYVCQAGSNRKVQDRDQTITLFQSFVYFQGLLVSTELYNSKGVTEITSPDDPILSVNPPDMVTMLGYETAYEVVEDFMKLFPLMVVNKDGRLVYFSFKDVRDNKADAYDWSDGFVRVYSVEFGNDNLASLNHVRYAISDGYKGLRADGSFTAKGAKAEQGDYAQLSKLTSYEDSKNMRFKPTPNSTVNSTIPVYPLAEVEYDKESDTYAVAGTKDMPCLLFQLSSVQIYNAKGEDGKTYRMFNVYNRRDTMNNIINTYWRDFIEVCGAQRTVTIKAVLKAQWLVGFDFRRPVYFKQLALYIFVQKITYKGHAESTIEGIII